MKRSNESERDSSSGCTKSSIWISKSYFDTVRHDLLLAKIARRVRDDDVLWLCKRILKASGKRGLPQGSVIGPLWANVFLDDVDRMLEQAQSATKQGIVRSRALHALRRRPGRVGELAPTASHWAPMVEQTAARGAGQARPDRQRREVAHRRLRRRGALRLSGIHVSLDGPATKTPGKKMVLARPRKKKRTEFLRALGETMRKCLHCAGRQGRARRSSTRGSEGG